jgi:Tfp pilus assembly protein PilV
MAGITLVENVVALTLACVSMAAIFALNGQTLYLLNSASENVTAEQNLQDRMESVRRASWSEVIDSTFVRDTALGTASPAALKTPVERITVTGWPAPAAGSAPTFTVIRQNGSAALSGTGAAIAAFSNYDLAKVDVSITWTASPGARSRSLATSTIWGEGFR